MILFSLLCKLKNRIRVELRCFLRNIFNVYNLNGIKIFIDNINHTKIEARALLFGKYEEEESFLIKEHLESSDIYLELGGGIGYNSIIASKKTENVFVVEANPFQINKIRRNMILNNSSFAIYAGMLSNSYKLEKIYIGNQFWSSGNSYVTNESLGIGTITFELLIQVRPSFLVVDIEGGEYEFFSSLLTSSIQLPKKIVCELHPSVYGMKRHYKLIELLNLKYNVSQFNGSEVYYCVLIGS